MLLVLALMRAHGRELISWPVVFVTRFTSRQCRVYDRKKELNDISALNENNGFRALKDGSCFRSPLYLVPRSQAGGGAPLCFVAKEFGKSHYPLFSPEAKCGERAMSECASLHFRDR